MKRSKVEPIPLIDVIYCPDCALRSMYWTGNWAKYIEVGYNDGKVHSEAEWYYIYECDICHSVELLIINE